MLRRLLVGGALLLVIIAACHSGSEADDRPALATQQSNLELGLVWSYAGSIPGKSCVRMNEPADPDTWDDNYLCSDTDAGFAWSYAGPISGAHCVLVNEPQEPGIEAWGDNYLCTPASTDLQMTWSTDGGTPGGNCVQIFEPAELSGWNDNYLCFLDAGVKDQRVSGILEPIRDGYLRGWAFDPDYRAPGEQLQVRVFVDAPAEVWPNVRATGVANLATGPEVIGGNGMTGYAIALPSECQDGGLHYVYAYGVGVRAGGEEVPGGLALLEGSPRQCGSVAASKPSIRVEFTDGGFFDSALALERFALPASPVAGSFALSDDEHYYSRKTWGEAAYGTQGGLIARKLLSFGSPQDHALVREWLLTAPVDNFWDSSTLVDTAAGRVFSANSTKHHLEGKATFEANAEFIMMARDYLAFTGDSEPFRNTPDRLLCLQQMDGGVRLATALANFGDAGTICDTPPWQLPTISPRIYPEHFQRAVPSPSSDVRAANPGRILGQYFTTTDPFRDVRIPLLPAYGGEALLPFKIYVNDNGQTASDGGLGRTGVGTVWSGFHDSTQAFTAALSFQDFQQWWTLPVAEGCRLTQGTDGGCLPGNYFVELHPVELTGTTYARWDGGVDSCPGNPAAGITCRGNPSYWFAPPWLTVATSVSGGATSKLFLSTPYTEPTFVRLSDKLEKAMNWQLRRIALPESNGVLTIPTDDSHFSGLPSPGVLTTNYYDLIRFGFKDGYVNLRFIESLDAYQEMQDTLNWTSLVDDGLRSSVAEKFVATFVETDAGADEGEVASWIARWGYLDGGAPDDRSVSIRFLPIQALAADLIPGTPSIRHKLGDMRNEGRLLPGLFRTNLALIEATPGRWQEQDKWTSRDPAHLDYAELRGDGGGDWHFFYGNFLGYGSWGNQEENGGVLMSTTSFMFQAGPYLEMVRDWQVLTTRLDEIAHQLDAGYSYPNDGGYDGGRVPLLHNYAREYVRRPIGKDGVTNEFTDGGTRDILVEICQHGRSTTLDSFGDQWCDYYKSIGYSLPENGSYLYAFAQGLLDLGIRTDGGVTVYDHAITGSKTTISLPSDVLSSFPPEVKRVVLSNLLAHGQKIKLTCDVLGSGNLRTLECCRQNLP